MPDWISALPRMIQFAFGAVLFGGPLFILYAHVSPEGWERRLTRIALVGMTAAALLAVVLQTAYLTDIALGALSANDIAWYLTDTHIGRISALRLAALAAYALIVYRRPQGFFCLAAQTLLGAGILGSFAWTGHGADGTALHTFSDVIHLLAAGVWVGALGSLVFLILGAWRNQDQAQMAAAGLDAFSRIGITVVALLVASGIGNSLALLGLSNIWSLYQSEYGLTLLIKIALFGAMLGLAAANRYWLAPALRRNLEQNTGSPDLRNLGGSLFLETVLALVVLGLAAHLGSIEPPH